MSELLVKTASKTVSDLRWGRMSWRVLLLLSLPAFVVGLAAGLLQ